MSKKNRIKRGSESRHNSRKQKRIKYEKKVFGKDFDLNPIVPTEYSLTKKRKYIDD